MNILMISDVYLPRVNGVSTSIFTFRRELRRLGHRVFLIAPDYGRSTDDERDIFRVPARTVWLDPEDRMMRMREGLALLETLREEGPALIHVQTPFVAHYLGLRLARHLGIPLVETYHTFFEEYLFHYAPFLPASLLRLLARRFSTRQGNQTRGMIVPSRAMRELLRGYGVSTPLWIVPTGLELPRFQGGDNKRFRIHYNIPPDRPLLVYIGRVAFEKNLDFLLRMLARLKNHRSDALLVIAGEGPAAKHLKKLGKRLGLEDNLLFTGYFSSHQALLDCYAGGDVFVFASRTETQGLVLLEAMAVGLPVVSTAKMGTRDILDPGRGALVVEEDETEFAAGVKQLLDNPATRHGLGEEGRAYVEEWSVEKMAEKLLRFYHIALDNFEP